MIVNDHRMVPGAAVAPNAAPPLDFPQIITADPHFLQMFAYLTPYAQSDLPVLITGEPGTGKELVAEAIWALSRPQRQVFHRLNCASLTESLCCSELFGHVRGAFTDARDPRPGKFRLAHGGSLFLDEVGDLPLAIQPKLLRAVEQGEIEPVGGDGPVEVDVRLIAATNQDLPRLIAQGRFRQDLYDRLAVLAIHLPPLRERPGDIPLLVRHFAQATAQAHGRDCPRLTSAGLNRLQKYPWPGNVRELKNVITRAVLLARKSLLGPDDLPLNPHVPGVRGFDQAKPQGVIPPRPSPGRLKELLEEEQGNVSALSRRLRVCSKTIYRWLRYYRLNLVDIRGAAAA